MCTPVCTDRRIESPMCDEAHTRSSLQVCLGFGEEFSELLVLCGAFDSAVNGFVSGFRCYKFR